MLHDRPNGKAYDKKNNKFYIFLFFLPPYQLKTSFKRIFIVVINELLITIIMFHS